MGKLSIIIPVYNEEKTISTVLDRIREAELLNGIEKEIIVINDFSTDGTEEIIDQYIKNHRDLNISLYNQNKNKGKGASVRLGISKSTGDYLVIQDADLEYDPREYNRLLEPVLQGVADVVYGSRFISGNPHRVLFFWHSVGNRILTFFSNMFTNVNLTDMAACYKLFKSDIIKSLHLKEDRFGFDAEVTARISRIRNIRLYEVGISYYGRTYSEGKKIGWKDGFRVLYCIIKYRIFK